ASHATSASGSHKGGIERADPMKPARFDYRRPDTIENALRLIADRGRDAAILAGGQSLVPMLNLRLAKPSLLIDIKRRSALDQIKIERDRLFIGAFAASRRRDAIGNRKVTPAAAHRRAATCCPSGDPQSRNFWRQPCARRSGGGAAGLCGVPR